MAEERVVSSRTVFQGQVVGLRVDDVELASGEVTTREVVEHSDVVVVVALDGEDNVLLVRQYRHAVDRQLLELPAGGMEPAESPEDCVRREMREETGYLPHRLERLGGYFSAPGYCTEYLHLYLATDLEPSPLVAEDTGSIELVRVPRERVLGLVASGEVCDAKSVAGLHMAFSALEKS
ncbi:MAG: NUDIX hydrolase [Dehalococcoidia bacterium]